MNDQEFIEAFYSGTLPNEQFHHRDHLRLTSVAQAEWVEPDLVPLP